MAKDKKVPALWAFSKDKFTYDTIQDMKNDMGLTDGMIVTCTGSESIEDGRNRQYRIYPAGTVKVYPEYDVTLNNGKIAIFIPKNEIQLKYLPNNTNLDDIKTPGFYAKKSNNFTIINQPFNSAFYLEVQNLIFNNNYALQKATSYGTNEVAYRTCDDSASSSPGWTNWNYVLPGKILQQYSTNINTPELERSFCRKIGLYRITNFNTVFPGNEFQEIYQWGILEVVQYNIGVNTSSIQTYRPDAAASNNNDPRTMWVLKRKVNTDVTVGTGWVLENGAYLL